MEENKKFYERKWFTWVTLFIFAPVGIICLWKYKHYKTIPAVIFTLIFGLIFLSVVGPKDKKTETSTSNANIIIKPEDKQSTISVTKKPPSENLPTEKPKPSVPAEYKSALSQANSYANTMHMSKKGVYDQLVSEYGGKFSAEAAQYAIDNIKTDWNAHALAKAKTYQDKMHMSPSANHDQLTSEHGEKFTQKEADYAIQHLND